MVTTDGLHTREASIARVVATVWVGRRWAQAAPAGNLHARVDPATCCALVIAMVREMTRTQQKDASDAVSRCLRSRKTPGYVQKTSADGRRAAVALSGATAQFRVPPVERVYGLATCKFSRSEALVLSLRTVQSQGS